MPTFRVVFVNGEKRTLDVEAERIDPAGSDILLTRGGSVVAALPRSQVLYVGSMS